MVEKLKFSLARFTKMIFVFSTRPKKGEIFRIILRFFFNLLLEDHAKVFLYMFFFLLTVKSAILWVVNYSAKKEEEEHLEHTSSRFEVKKNCTPKTN